MLTVVTKNNHTHDCTSQEQLDRFLAAGWKKAKKQPKANPDEGKTKDPPAGDSDNPAEGEK